MLSPADRNLIAADPTLPGLEMVLDPERLLSLVQREYPGRVTDLTTTYLRYKPGTSCLAGLQLETDEGRIDGYVITASERAEGKYRLRKADAVPGGPFGTMGVLCQTAPLLIRVFPNDPDLPALRRLLTHQGQAWPFPSTDPTTATILRYKPQRRAVLRVRSENHAEGCVVKVHARNRYHAALRGASLVPPTPEYATAALINHDLRAQTLLMRWVPGKVLVDLSLDPTWPARGVEAVGEALRAFHARSYLRTEPRFSDHLRDHLQGLAPMLTRLLPARAGVIRTHVQSLIGALDEFSTPTATIHGDFYAKQVLIDRGKVGFLDFDQLQVGDAAEDLGCFRAHLERDVLRGRLDPRRAEELWEALCVGYRARSSEWDRRVSLFTSIGCLNLVPDPFRHREPGWSDRAEQLLEASRTRFAPVLGGRRLVTCP